MKRIFEGASNTHIEHDLATRCCRVWRTRPDFTLSLHHLSNRLSLARHATLQLYTTVSFICQMWILVLNAAMQYWKEKIRKLFFFFFIGKHYWNPWDIKFIFLNKNTTFGCRPMFCHTFTIGDFIFWPIPLIYWSVTCR